MPLPDQDFVLQKTCLLLDRLLLPWRRRGLGLLQVGLGAGLGPDYFCRAGYAVTALDPSAHQLEQARCRAAIRADFCLGQPDQQPFDDNSFDLVVLNHLGLDPHNRPDSPDILSEALRLAVRGIIILEWNKHSLGVYHNQQARPRVSPARLSALAGELCPECKQRLLSVLPLPPACWPKRPDVPSGEPASQNSGFFWDNLVFGLGLGALIGLRLDLEPSAAAMTGVLTEQTRQFNEGQVVSLTQSNYSPTQKRPL